ncbi:sulfotransferase [Pontibacter sp. G13]|uniref:sulfotransferase n=1 Tax=Pontibacter sp. G13 TaxID=3074898 RepID=UPI002889E247|nr:sulfotransferase [Pontibacter sp. G13]WNJ19000.1 sulfotransferase [Pontibacter sp. G13]
MTLALNRKIVYLIGSGRSGTTLMDVAIGNAADVFSCGELNRYPKHKGIPTGVTECSLSGSFWRAFTGRFAEDCDWDRQRNLHWWFEYHLGAIARVFGIQLYPHYSEYKQFVSNLYSEIFDEIDESIIVDSSKYPGRALTVAELDDFEVVFVYIRRDPVSVVNSFSKTTTMQPSKSWLNANLYYFSTNLLAQWTLKKLRRKHRVAEIRYEDILENPVEVLSGIQGQIGVDLSQSIRSVEMGTPWEVGALFEGNRIRVQSHLHLQKDLPEHPPTWKNRATRFFNQWVYPKPSKRNKPATA